MTEPQIDPLSRSAGERTNAPEWTVSELSGALKRTVEDAYGHVRVRGEISQAKRHSSGHLYLSLKDENAVLAAVCWRGVAGKLTIRPEDGMEVIATGRITTYAGQSKYQLVIESLELAGMGALLRLLEERKKKLAAEGLFDPARKKPIPFLPESIGIITSETGAVIRDILHRIEDRFPRRVLLWPVAVQGDGAAAQVIAAIKGFAAAPPALRPSVIIVARGGGSVEDLMPFNDEALVRAVAACPIPVISAIGHETDVTLIDYAADRRAPTPTAAAEMAVPVRADWLLTLESLADRQRSALRRALAQGREKLMFLARGLLEPARILENLTQRLDERAARLGRAMAGFLGQKMQAQRGLSGLLGINLLLAPLRLSAERLKTLADRRGQSLARLQERLQDRLSAAGRMLALTSYQQTLARGFALVLTERGEPMTEAARLKEGERLRLRFHDGERSVTVDDAKPAPKPAQGRLL